jgi:hypothetical protein
MAHRYKLLALACLSCHGVSGRSPVTSEQAQAVPTEARFEALGGPAFQCLHPGAKPLRVEAIVDLYLPPSLPLSGTRIELRDEQSEVYLVPRAWYSMHNSFYALGPVYGHGAALRNVTGNYLVAASELEPERAFVPMPGVVETCTPESKRDITLQLERIQAHLGLTAPVDQPFVNKLGERATVQWFPDAGESFVELPKGTFIFVGVGKYLERLVLGYPDYNACGPSVDPGPVGLRTLTRIHTVVSQLRATALSELQSAFRVGSGCLGLAVYRPQ